MNRRAVLRASLLAPAAAWQACRNRVPGGKRKLRVAAARYLTMNPFFLADERGYFAEEGFDLEIVQLPSGPQTVPLLAGGRLDAAFVSLTPAFVNAVSEGASLRIVAGREKITKCGDVASIWARRAAFPGGLKSLRELRGKRLAMQQKATSSEFLTDELLWSAGLRQEELNVIHMRHSDAAAALAAGKVDAIFGGSHLERSFVALKPELIEWSGSKSLEGTQFSYIFFGPSLLAAGSEAGGRFLAAYLRGTQAYLAGATPRFQDEFVRKNNLDPEAARRFCRETQTAGGKVDLASLRRFIAWAVRKGYSQSALETSQLVDPRPLQLAHGLLAAGRRTES